MAKRIDVHHDHQGVARIQNLPAPVSANEPARNGDVAALLAQRNYIEQPVRAVEASNIVVGAPGANHDGVVFNVADAAPLRRLALVGQTNPVENGIYVYNGAAVPLTRSGDTYQGGTVFLAGGDGTNGKNTAWIQTTDSPTVDTDALNFTQFGTLITAGSGLTMTGNVISLTSPVPVALGGTNANSTAAAKASLGYTTTFEANFGDGATTSFAINHGLGNRYPTIIVVNNATNQPEDVQVTYTDATHCQLDADSWATTPPAAAAYRVICRG